MTSVVAKCPKCDRFLLAGAMAKFCSKCGTPLERVENLIAKMAGVK